MLLVQRFFLGTVYAKRPRPQLKVVSRHPDADETYLPIVFVDIVVIVQFLDLSTFFCR